MRKIWILIVIVLVAINLLGCSKKTEELPKSDIPEEVVVENDIDKLEQATDEDIEEKPIIDEDDKKEETIAQEPNKNEKNKGEPRVNDKPEDGRFRIPSFDTVDFDGNKITNDFFAGNNITIVTIWTTT